MAASTVAVRAELFKGGREQGTDLLAALGAGLAHEHVIGENGGTLVLAQLDLAQRITGSGGEEVAIGAKRREMGRWRHLRHDFGEEGRHHSTATMAQPGCALRTAETAAPLETATSLKRCSTPATLAKTMYMAFSIVKDTTL